MRITLLIAIIMLAVGLNAQEVINIQPLPADTLTLTASANFELADINESSAIVKSRNFKTVFWTLNDSGDSARIFAFNNQGKTLKPEWMEDFSGISVSDAVNIDWEDIAADDQGNLIIAACGNNGNMRRDLAIYLVKEPHPLATVQTRYYKKIPFYYPDQTFPPSKYNYDCEAVFYAFGKIYMLTKHRSDTNTTLYRLDTMNQLEDNPLVKLSTFNIGGMVTAADATPDGTKLAVLTYTNIWIFETQTANNWFTGTISYMPIKAKQCEGICWDGDQLYITNEQTEIIKVPMDKFTVVSK